MLVEVSETKEQKKNKDTAKPGQKMHNFTACSTLKISVHRLVFPGKGWLCVRLEVCGKRAQQECFNINAQWLVCLAKSVLCVRLEFSENKRSLRMQQEEARA